MDLFGWFEEIFQGFTDLVNQLFTGIGDFFGGLFGGN